MFKIAIISYNYTIEYSPFLKNLCNWLVNQKKGKVDYFMNKSYVNKYKNNDCQLFVINDGHSLEKTLLRKFLLTKNKRFSLKLKPYFEKEYDLVFVVDYPSLEIADDLKLDFTKVIFLSMEGVDFFKEKNPNDVLTLLSKCKFIVIPDYKRAEEINLFVGTKLCFQYFPISHRPSHFVEISEEPKKNLCIVYSGYFAMWACLKEFLKSYCHTKLDKTTKLIFHGHAIGTEDYLQEILKISEGIQNFSIDDKFYNEATHHQFLLNNDIGLAFYKSPNGTGNFINILYSSGKISSYLWAGLGVITNIKDPLTRKPPFIYISSITAKNINKAISKYLKNPKLYQKTALITARKKYNFDIYMEKLWKDIVK